MGRKFHDVLEEEHILAIIQSPLPTFSEPHLEGTF